MMPLKKEAEALRREVSDLKGSLAELQYNFAMKTESLEQTMTDPKGSVARSTLVLPDAHGGTSAGIDLSYGNVQDRAKVAVDVQFQELQETIAAQFQELKDEFQDTKDQMTRVTEVVTELEMTPSDLDALEERIRKLDEDYRQTEAKIHLKGDVVTPKEAKEPGEEKSEEEEAALILNIVRQEVDK